MARSKLARCFHHPIGIKGLTQRLEHGTKRIGKIGLVTLHGFDLARAGIALRQSGRELPKRSQQLTDRTHASVGEPGLA